MPIACVYCDGSHDLPAEVRDCWQRGGGAPAPPAAPVTAARPPVAEPAPQSGSTGTGLAGAGLADLGSNGVATIGRGPEQLGRHAIVLAGAPIPPAWGDVERFVLQPDDLDAPRRVIDRLRSAWDHSSSLVVELDPRIVAKVIEPVARAVPPRPVEHSSATPYELGARFQFDIDHLRHLLVANAVDLRADTEPRWWAFEKALALGATPAPDPAVADVMLPDGRLAWLDAGPPRRLEPIDDIVIVHAVCLEHGSSAPPAEADPATPVTVLAPDQLAAVEHGEGSARIIAPAGSGKTRVLTERARRLVTDWQVPPSAIGLVAFNARAQQEMRERTADLPGLQVRTLNSIALAIVNGSAPFAARERTRRTITEPEVRRILDRLVRVRRVRNTDPMAAWIEALGLIRLGLVSPSETEARYEGEVDGLAEVWPRYLDELDRDGVIDFDGQIHGALEVLLTDPEARAVAQRCCRHLLVDEFQDLTPAHVLLIRLLAGPAGAVFGVGDDDQTIYGYNGADPGWLIDFDTIFPGAAAHPLEVNYRCPPDVVEVADRLVRHNRRRVDKRIRAATETADGSAEQASDPTGRPGWSVHGADDPVAATVEHVVERVGAGTAPSDIAVLTRVNVVLAPVQVALGAAGVPVARAIGAELLDRTAVRAVLAWLRLAQGARFDPTDLAEALRRPSRSLRPNVADWVAEQTDVGGLRRLARRLNDERSVERVEAFADDVHRLVQAAEQGASTTSLVGTVIDEIGLAGAVSRLDDHRRGMNRPAQGDELVALRQLASLYDRAGHSADSTERGFEGWLRSRLAVPADPAGVVLATVHRVKGQEWPEVVIHLADRAQFPHRLADDTEEERRVFHVGITRASRHVALVTGDEPSPFVAELTTEPPVNPPPSLQPATDERLDRAPRAGSGRRSSGDRSDHPLLDRSTVVVGVGMTLVDQGVDWEIVEVGADALVARSATGAQRRFGIDRPIRTIGGQQGRPIVHEGGSGGEVDPTAALVFDELRRWRQLARDGKPAYTVFSDRTLVEIAERRPNDRTSLSRVTGVGPAKLDSFGDQVIEVVATALQRSESASDADPAS